MRTGCSVNGVVPGTGSSGVVGYGFRGRKIEEIVAGGPDVAAG